MVVFEDGLARKSEYRRFVIRGVEGQNDVASMQEVITRRFRRLLDEQADSEEISGESGQMLVDLLAERIGIDLPEDRDYATVAGHALWLLKRLPEVGDYVDDQGWRFEIVDMDGRKIDKLLVAER
jgi:putative hemolysin